MILNIDQFSFETSLDKARWIPWRWAIETFLDTPQHPPERFVSVVRCVFPVPPRGGIGIIRHVFPSLPNESWYVEGNRVLALTRNLASDLRLPSTCNTALFDLLRDAHINPVRLRVVGPCKPSRISDAWICKRTRSTRSSMLYPPAATRQPP
jgi:hypothetical protein